MQFGVCSLASPQDFDHQHRDTFLHQEETDSPVGPMSEGEEEEFEVRESEPYSVHSS